MQKKSRRQCFVKVPIPYSKAQVRANIPVPVSVIEHHFSVLNLHACTTNIKEIECMIDSNQLSPVRKSEHLSDEIPSRHRYTGVSEMDNQSHSKPKVLTNYNDSVSGKIYHKLLHIIGEVMRIWTRKYL
ncbi:hypothetical protein VNO77_22811 [Canavalia gladiata]|uniref:Uncharacterized protein n=1 Tax=Canavalia gladiata TaxID=3824 RepID=A0AAN9L3S6_CANGL